MKNDKRPVKISLARHNRIIMGQGEEENTFWKKIFVPQYIFVSNILRTKYFSVIIFSDFFFYDNAIPEVFTESIIYKIIQFNKRQLEMFTTNL